jgi:poly(3-hydroxybutyrate) depolymerase
VERGRGAARGGRYLPEGAIGRVGRDFSATAVIWEFFRTHPKP